ncbi:LpxL/LpxP family Kdo(2)-lipid IV(A) lauroyl/palmitoleoyl acyltransferase [Pseudoalteromonas fenneropenaei]|uniref:Lipid A biosynthesis acyltransferase n=1 Tax=Pseudoalteromonas fenneropenaei TaxID=1737459 RepID=A0ABV7CHA6_9GAMM
MVTKPPFQWQFLAPKFWLTWLGVIFLYTLSWLPQSIQIGLGRLLGKLAYRLMKKRRHIATVNIRLCFPELSAQQQTQLVKENLEQTGIATFESGMAWWWPAWRLRRVYGSVQGLQHIEHIQAAGKGALLLVPHMLHLEMASRMLGVHKQGIGFYRPHNNALMEFLMTRGRLRSNEFLIGKRDVKGLLKALKDGKLCYYLPDQDYGRNRCEFVPFFAVEQTATTTGTLLFASSEYCETLSLASYRDKQGKYHLEIMPVLADFPSADSKQDVTRVNQRMEAAIAKAPEQYMWVHRRFKTRPNESDPSLY